MVYFLLWVADELRNIREDNCDERERVMRYQNWQRVEFNGE